jgi:Protein of unknown function (DUF3617)
MSTLRILSFVLSVSFCWAVASGAAPVSLDVKPGLWEVTSTGEVSGTPPIPAEQLAKLAPAQRAQVVAAMTAAMAAANKPVVFKQCLTEKSLQRGFEPDPNMAKDSCKQTVVSSTSTVLQVQMECTGPQKVSGTIHFEAASSEAVTGTVDMTVSDGGNTIQVSRTLQSKWLGADCGKVKP